MHFIFFIFFSSPDPCHSNTASISMQCADGPDVGIDGCRRQRPFLALGTPGPGRPVSEGADEAPEVVPGYAPHVRYAA